MSVCPKPAARLIPEAPFATVPKNCPPFGTPSTAPNVSGAKWYIPPIMDVRPCPSPDVGTIPRRSTSSSDALDTCLDTNSLCLGEYAILAFPRDSPTIRDSPSEPAAPCPAPPSARTMSPMPAPDISMGMSMPRISFICRLYYTISTFPGKLSEASPDPVLADFSAFSDFSDSRISSSSSK